MSGPSPLTGQTQAANLIGVTAAVRGNVELSRTGTVGKVIESGANIFLGDQISTDDKGRLQILLLDETVFTIGPNSAMVIDQFVYDPANHDGEIKTKIVKGTFRFVTGQIAHKKPSRMRVDLPAGSIGVRGTIVAGQVDGMHSFVALMGPGDGNNAGANQGSIVLSNVVNGQTVEETVNRTGYGSVIDGVGSAPSPAFQVPAEQMNNLVSNFSPGPSDQGSGASGSGGNSDSAAPDINVGSISNAGGENTFAALGTVNDLASLEETISNIGNETDPARQNSTTNSPAAPPTPGTTVNFYASEGVELSRFGVFGSYDFYLEINDESFGGSNSYVQGSATIDGMPSSFKYVIPETSFDDMDTSVFMDFTNDADNNRIPNTDPSDPGHLQGADIRLTFASDPHDGLPTSVAHDVMVHKADGNEDEWAGGADTADLASKTT
ncbi:MAG: FecR family protein [Candidatus Omnitrophica bacterium]|nr:FecR family protein [Candidatus Omnitrophota bacterium]